MTVVGCRLLVLEKWWTKNPQILLQTPKNLESNNKKLC